MIIYKVTCLINGKSYIGQQLNNRQNRTYIGSGILIKNAIRKYGRENFIKEILHYCSSKKELNEKEIFYIEKFNSTEENIGYNLDKGGKRTLDEHYSLEMSKKLKNRKFSDEHKQKISENHSDVSGDKNPMFGKKHTNETKLKIIEKIKKWNERGGYTDEIREKKRKKFTGRGNPNYNNSEVIQIDENDMIVKVWKDLLSLKEEGFNTKLISMACRGKRNKTQGFKWQFKS